MDVNGTIKLLINLLKEKIQKFNRRSNMQLCDNNKLISPHAVAFSLTHTYTLLNNNNN